MTNEPEPDVLELVANAVKAWRIFRELTDTEPEVLAAFDALEKAWPR